jgi:L-aspartate oxidase
VLRDRHGIERTIRGLYPIASSHSAAADPALVGLMIAVTAWQREESRGGHFRSDFPDALPSAVTSTISLSEALDAARNIVESGSLSVGSAQP